MDPLDPLDPKVLLDQLAPLGQTELPVLVGLDLRVLQVLQVLQVL